MYVATFPGYKQEYRRCQLLNLHSSGVIRKRISKQFGIYVHQRDSMYALCVTLQTSRQFSHSQHTSYNISTVMDSML